MTNVVSNSPMTNVVSGSRFPIFVIPGALVVAALACSSQTITVQPPTFNAPTSVATSCFDTAARRFVERSQCSAEQAVDDRQFHWLALVTQGARGEIAAVDVSDARALDSDTRVPGFTYQSIGEVPVRVVVPDARPELAIVASFGSRVVESIPLANLHPDVANETAHAPLVLSEGPTDLVATRVGDRDFVYVILPQAGKVAWAELLADGSFGPATEVDLVPLVSPGVHAERGDSFRRLCPVDRPLVDLAGSFVEPTPAAELRAEPSRLRVDGQVLLVADRNGSGIHRYQIAIADGALGVMIPMATDAPVRDFALTPVVADQVGAEPTSSRYLYAIDDRDGSVLVLDYDETSADFGAILTVSDHDPADRVDLSASALRLEVVDNAGPWCALDDGAFEPASAGPARLRGVFVVASLINGQLRVIDVEDRDASCRGGDALCINSPLPEEVGVAIDRHRPRVGSTITAPIRLRANPTFRFNRNQERLSADGTRVSGLGPELEPIGDCPDAMRNIFPGICVVDDPWAARGETWAARWEGALIANAGRGLGQLIGGGIEISTGSFCNEGVLSRQALAMPLSADAPELGLSADAVFITSDLPPQRRDDARCRLFALSADGVRPIEVGFEVVEAYEQRLVLGDAVRDVVTCESGPGACQDAASLEVCPLECERRFPAYDYAAVAHCFPELAEIEFRSRGNYVVSGEQSGAAHRVMSQAGQCLVDETLDPRFASRAVAGKHFENRFLTLNISDVRGRVETSLLPGEVAELAFTVENVPLPSGILLGRRSRNQGTAAGSLVGDMRYVPGLDRLLVVDSGADALVSIATDPFALNTEEIFE